MKHSSVIKKQYVLDENNKKVAVMLDIEVYRKIEDAIENYGLMKYISENKDDKPLKAEEAKSYYRKRKKA